MAVSLSGMSLHTNNDNEGSWGGTDGPDTYNNAIQGSNSESWQVSKNSSEAGTLTKSSTLNATRGLFTFWMSSNLAPYYTEIELQLESTTNNFKIFTVATSSNKDVGGNFVASAIDYVNKGIETGTFAPASFSKTVITVDNSSSGNIRSVINNWIDAMYFGPGHTVSGTTTGNKLFEEAAAVDELTANQYGVMWNYNGIIYSQGDIDLIGTALTSDSETLVFVDTINGYDTYNFDVSGTVTLKNTGIIGAGTIDFNLDASGATAFLMTGGFLTSCNALTLIDGQTFDDVVINSCATSSIANDPDGCTWNTSGLITIETNGSLSNCTINQSTSTESVTTASLEVLTGNTFVSDGSNHAVILTSIGDGSMDWDNQLSGYASSDGSTGNEGVYVNVGSGNLTINVASGASTPSIRTAGATVTVVAGAVTVQVKVVDSDGDNIENANVMIRAADGTGPYPFQESVTITSSGTTATVTHTAHGLATNDKVDILGVTNGANYDGVKQITVTDANTYTYTLGATQTSPATGTITSTFVALQGLTNATGIINTSRTYATDQPVTGWARKSTASPYYKQAGINNTINSASGLSAVALLILDE